MTNYYAHTPPRSDPLRWHLLVDHLEAVASVASSFADKFGASNLGRVLGISHDSAKADPRFQAYLRDCQAGRPGVGCRHSAPGAKASHSVLGIFALAVLGHHGGMPDAAELRVALDRADSLSVEAAVGMIESLGGLPDIRSTLPIWAKERSAAEFLLRMAFSALVDADRLDTEAHGSPHLTGLRGGHIAIGDYRQKLDVRLAKFVDPVTDVQRVRANILAACRAAAPLPQGFFRLTVPTGGGKTLSGLAFALAHAEMHALERVIVAIPYTSIIDQTAQVFSEVFQPYPILEHHSAIEESDVNEGQSQSEIRRRLAAENWDSPLVVTTTVQLFESLLSNRPARCRKLHNIVRSVIILDEVQTLPPHTLGPILDVLRELVEHYHCSVVFCTATQPEYSGVDSRLELKTTEIVPDYPRHFAALERVEFEVEEEERTIGEVAASIDSVEQILVVLNSRKDALEIVQTCRREDGLRHLSTLLCGHHRKKVIKEVKERLDSRRQVRLVSTQVVEAGVDVDFPLVMRDIGPLDRIIQVAGRCNREGKLPGKGRCIVFRLAERRSPKGPYRTFTDLTLPLLDEYGARLAAKEATERYFRDIFQFTETGSLEKNGDAAEVQKLRRDLAYRTVAERFRLIEDNTTPVVIANYPFADVEEALEGWGYLSPRTWFRRISPFTVSLFEHDLRSLRAGEWIQEHESGALIYTGRYDNLYGMTPEVIDPTDLIA